MWLLHLKRISICSYSICCHKAVFCLAAQSLTLSAVNLGLHESPLHTGHEVTPCSTHTHTHARTHAHTHTHTDTKTALLGDSYRHRNFLLNAILENKVGSCKPSYSWHHSLPCPCTRRIALTRCLPMPHPLWALRNQKTAKNRAGENSKRQRMNFFLCSVLWKHMLCRTCNILHQAGEKGPTKGATRKQRLACFKHQYTIKQKITHDWHSRKEAERIQKDPNNCLHGVHHGM